MAGVFRMVTDFVPRGDQPRAVAELCAGIDRGDRFQVLLGVTGSGKTFTAAKVIEHHGRPALVIAPNKTLAAQLYSELRELFPSNAVHYFVSYYDYYQPEAYLPATDTYIEKDAIINDAIDRMRHAATHALLSRPDVVIVASVSCIYGMGSAESYHGMLISIEKNGACARDELLRKLVDIQYERNDVDFHRGTFRVRGDVIEIFPAYEEDRAIRVELWGDEVDGIKEIDPMRGRVLGELDRVALYPGSHYVTEREQRERAIAAIRAELEERLGWFDGQGRFLEKQRLSERTSYDLEMLEQMGFCHGIENYSRHLSGRPAGEPPPTLLDYFPEDFLLIIDESHQTLPQLGAMYRGDRARKETLVEHGFRLESALDNRPLKLEELERYFRRVLFVSATPGDEEIRRAGGVVVEQIIRPTGLVDPRIVVRPVRNQVDELLGLIRERVAQGERVLVTTLTKRMAEDLTDYYAELGVRVRYLHSDVDTLERVEILRDLRRGEFDVLIGINLLREGLDLPEVSLVAILDADKEGFLRSPRSLIQTIGRAARNVNGTVVMFADQRTEAIERAVGETERRRELQLAFNAEHDITPQTIVKAILDMSPSSGNRDYYTVSRAPRAAEAESGGDLIDLAERLRQEMLAAAEGLDFERAARLRDQLRALREKHPELGASIGTPPAPGKRARAGAAATRPGARGSGGRMRPGRARSRR
jgi:excinuclease ABC subunit B